jgi:hypothetical protein
MPVSQQIRSLKRPPLAPRSETTCLDSLTPATHWVVVTSGSGSNPDNYLINNPWFVGGQSMKLSSRTSNYDLDWISVYNGTPSCGLSQRILVNSLSTEIQPADSVVGGNVMIYDISVDNITVQLIAQSSEGDITDMLIWTDSSPAASWQPFTTLVDLPISDHVYARFRDELGNESGTFSDSIYPGESPLDQSIIYIPIIQK